MPLLGESQSRNTPVSVKDAVRFIGGPMLAGSVVVLVVVVDGNVVDVDMVVDVVGVGEDNS